MQEKQQCPSKNTCIIAIGMSGTGKTTFVNVFRLVINIEILLEIHKCSLHQSRSRSKGIAIQTFYRHSINTWV